MADTSRKHEKMPDGVKILVLFIEVKERNTKGVAEAANNKKNDPPCFYT